METVEHPTALVVNDDAWQLGLAASLLEQNGLRVIACQSAEEALHVLHERRGVDVIVTDLHMPQIDGWRFCRLLRSPEYAALNTIPILVVSATFSGIDADQITRDLGADAFLSVPYAPEALQTHVRALLDGRTPRLSPSVLIVEDSKTLATALRRAFEANGYTVEVAFTGGAGKHLLEVLQPDITILDYHLPDMQGDELLAACKHAQKPSVAMMITSDPTPELALQFLRRGADGYVRKPFDPAYLIDLCAKACRERALLYVETLLEERTQKLRLAVEEVQAARDYAENIIHSSPDLIVSVDTERRIMAFNKAAEQAFGYTREEALGQPVHILYADPCIGGDVHRRTVQEGSFTGEITNRRQDGTTFEAYLSASVLRDAHGQVIGVMGISRDITAHKRNEAALQAAKDAAEAANRTKSTFLANVSHEIRTPMNGIIGMTDLALRTNLSAEQHEYLDLVKISAEALLSVINDLLDFSKIEAGKLQLDQAAFSLRSSLNEAMKTLAIPAHQKGLELICRVHPEVPGQIIGDAGRLRQVIVNLVGNAVKFTAQGEIVLTVTPDATSTLAAATCDSEWQPLSLHITVQDTGIGITPAQQQVIFEPFAQADGSTTRRYGGTGLGLSIAAQLVALMDGNIWIESTPGVGSTFHFTARFGLVEPQEKAAPPGAVQGIAVLVVAQNATQGDFLYQVLRHGQMCPTLVHNTLQARATLTQAQASGQPFALVVVDAYTPAWDKMIVWLRAHPELTHTPLLALTPAIHNGDRQRWQQLGVAAWVTKPVVEAELWAAILNAIAPPIDDPALPRPKARLAGRTAHPLRLLLAEDNLVNQKLAVRLLEQRGHQVTVVQDGVAVLAAVAQQTFDLVLMDVQMPHMDGLEATITLREQERHTRMHVPIVAMTAHAMQGDRERCLRAGMDDYLTKPLHPEELIEVVERLGQPGTLEACHQYLPDSSEVFNPQAMWSRVGEDLELLEELIDLFLSDYPQRLTQLQEALSRADYTTLARSAHAMKGALGNMSANAAYTAALTLEARARAGDQPGAASALANLKTELERLQPALTAFIGTKHP